MSSITYTHPYSYWEKKHFTQYDQIVVGAGFSGLWTAIELKKKFPNRSVLIVEKGLFPSGASTKNAGFACMGSISELEDDVKNIGVDEVLQLFENRRKGLEIIRSVLGDDKIAYKENGSFELLTNEDEYYLNKIHFWNDALQGNAFEEVSINSFSFNGFTAAIKNNWEGALDTGLYYKNLLKKALSLGIEIHNNTKVEKIERSNGKHSVHCAAALFRARRLIICTNAFAKELISTIDIEPARGQVIITKPIKDLGFKGIYHFDAGYYYFREIDGRVLFGGGRNIDKETENTNVMAKNEIIYNDLLEKLTQQILMNTAFEIEHSWSGIMGFANSKKPICRRLDESTFILAGLGGMGVALAPYMAKELIDLVD